MIDKTHLSVGYLMRKVIHITFNGGIAILAFYFPESYLTPAASLVFAVLFVFEIIRLKTWAKPIVHKVIDPVLKKQEFDTFTGVFWAALAAFILAIFVSPQTLSYGFAVFALSDASAALVGRTLKTPRLYQNKTVGGSTAFFIAVFLVTILFIRFTSTGAAQPLYLGLIISSFLTLLELFSYPFDDNFTILFFATVLWHFLVV